MLNTIDLFVVGALAALILVLISKSRGSLLVVALSLGCLSGCAPGWSAVRAVAESGRVAVAEFERYDAAHKRAILKEHPECKAAVNVRACYSDALAPYVAKRAPVLTATDALAPVLREASEAAKVGAGDPPALAARLGVLVAEVLKAIATLRSAP